MTEKLDNTDLVDARATQETAKTLETAGVKVVAIDNPEQLEKCLQELKDNASHEESLDDSDAARLTAQYAPDGAIFRHPLDLPEMPDFKEFYKANNQVLFDVLDNFYEAAMRNCKAHLSSFCGPRHEWGTVFLMEDNSCVFIGAPMIETPVSHGRFDSMESWNDYAKEIQEADAVAHQKYMDEQANTKGPDSVQ